MANFDAANQICNHCGAKFVEHENSTESFKIHYCETCTPGAFIGGMRGESEEEGTHE